MAKKCLNIVNCLKGTLRFPPASTNTSFLFSNVISLKPLYLVNTCTVTNLSHIMQRSMTTSMRYKGSIFHQEDESLKEFHEFDQNLAIELKDYSPSLIPLYSHNFTDYVNSSETLQTLVMFGVKLSVVQETFPESLEFLVKLNAKTDIKLKLQYMKSLGITAREFGEVLTKNILILDPQRNASDLDKVVNYLQSKKFSYAQITSIVVKHPQIFNVDVLKLDGILGFYQKIPTNYENRPVHFSGDDVRAIITKCPQLTAASLEDVYLQVKRLEVSFEFSISQLRQLILQRPKLLLADENRLRILYKLYVNEMGLTHEQLVKNPFVFDTRLKIVESRHFYLKYLGRNIYKEEEPGYLSLYHIVCLNDEDFCKTCQLGPYSKYELFLKTL